MRHAGWFTIGAFGAAAAWGCGDGSDATKPSSSAALTPADQAEAVPAAGVGLSRALAGSVERGDVPGVVGLVVDRDGVSFEGAAGQLSVAGGAAMPVDAIFSIASMTKPVTSVAVMQLFERGLLELDDPVSEFLPGFDALEVLTSFDPATGAFEAAPATTVLTVRHLLSHTSGIGYAFSNSTVARLQRGTPAAEWELPLLNEPGARWNYGASTRVLGLIVEELTGEPLADFFEAEIFAPLGMVDTSYAVPASEQARVPTLHVRGADNNLTESPQDGVPATPVPPFNGDGGLYSTAQDYGQFMRLFLNGGALGDTRILSESSVQLMGDNQIGAIFVEQQEAANPTLTKPFPLGAGVDKFGLGFQITASDGGGVARSAGSMAWAGLFNTEFWIDPEQGIAATLLMQVLPFYDEGALRVLHDFEAAVYQGLTPEPAK
jgi:CubicO group peptidase (beta-lactamase class C family)